MHDQRPRIVEKHLPRRAAEAPERALQAVEPRRLPLKPERLNEHPARIAERRHKQMDPHRLPADRHAHLAEVDLQLLARRRLEANAGPRLGLQHLAQRRHGALDHPQRCHHPALPRQILAKHVAVPAMLAEPLRKPILQTIQLAPPTGLPVRDPAVRRYVTSNRFMAAAELRRNPPDAPPQPFQPHHRRNLVRRPHRPPPQFVQLRGENNAPRAADRVGRRSAQNDPKAPEDAISPQTRRAKLTADPPPQNHATCRNPLIAFKLEFGALA